MTSRFIKIGVAFWIAVFALVVFIVLSPKNESFEHRASGAPEHQVKPQQTKEEAPLNFTFPLYTKTAALVCPLAVALDPREGHGLKEALDAHLSIFGHEDAIAKSGCQEWREGLPILLTSEGLTDATGWNAKNLCGMVSFTGGYIFSCDLRNATKEEGDLAALQRSEQGLSKALQDPSKVRLMECIGVNPWKEKPTGWMPPTEEECAALKQKLGIAAHPNDSTTVSDTPPSTATEEKVPASDSQAAPE